MTYVAESLQCSPQVYEVQEICGNLIKAGFFNVIVQDRENTRQEAHGPHRSPEKTVQINKHI